MQVRKSIMLEDTKLQFIGKGILVGLLAGFIVSFFRLIIEHLMNYVVLLYQFLYLQPQWIILWVLFSLAMALFVGKLVKSDPNIIGSGIPQVEGQLQGAIHVNFLSVLWKKFLGGILSIGFGLFLGREGPSIQLGAATGQGVNSLFKGNSTQEKVFISSGASAGLSAAFNAPIAGLLFVLEEMHHNFSPLIGLTSLVSALVANFISLNFFGLNPALNIGEVSAFPINKYGYLILLGIFVGLFGLLYQKVLLSLPKIFGRISFLPSHYYGLLPFLLVIPIGLFCPEILGGGGEIILDLSKSSPTLMIMIGLFVIRFIFSMISYGGNLPGGIFLPILSLGAILGSIFGNIAIPISGLPPVYMKNFIVYAMAGYFTAIGKAPLTALVLVTEMVGSLNQLMPLAVVSVTAFMVTDMAGASPIYEALLEKLLSKKEPLLQDHKKEMIDIPILAESSLDGAMIRDITWPENILITSIRRGDKEIIIDGDTTIHVGDCLVVLTYEDVSSQARKQMMDIVMDKE